MPLIATPAVVLRTYRYSETSKVVRLATRELGVQSAIAKGVLRARSPFGAALEFLSEGEAQLYFRDSRELHTLAAFDVTNLRRGLALDLARFAAAAALAELMLQMAPPAPVPAAFGALTAGLELLVSVPPAEVEAAAVRALWVLVSELGFGPSLVACVRDGTTVAPDTKTAVALSLAEGGVYCERCAPAQPPTRLLPADYRALLTLNDPAAPLPALDPPHAAAHRRLVARFARHHVGVDSLAALDSWERHAWAPPTLSSAAS
jgi:DNA repair protein RecO (recombination protein O)